MPAASVIGGTTPLPRSDEMYVTKVWTVLTKVVVIVRLKFRSNKRNETLGISVIKDGSVPNVLLG